MYIHILMLLLIVIVVAIFNTNTEHFAQYEYPIISDGVTPPDHSCIKLVASKGWIDLNDKSAKAKERRSIIADMEIARIPQTVFSNTIHPNVGACTFGDDVMYLYNNMNGKNAIDPSSCEMRGITADNKYVYHKLKKVNDLSPITPKGCMIDLERFDKTSFNALLDDAYNLKMYPDIKEKKDYKEALDVLTEDNKKMRTEVDVMQSHCKIRGKAAISGINDSERIQGDCRDIYTPWNKTGGWAFNYLDRHNIQCGPGEVLSKFKLESTYHPDKARYKYRCCKIDSYPVSRKIKENVSKTSTAFQNSQNWNTMGLTSHMLQCQKDGNYQGMIKRFQLESQYANSGKSDAKYDYECVTHTPYGLINKTIKTSCRKMRTRKNEFAPTFNYLDRHEVGCNDGEGINELALRADNAGIYYDYSCCRPEIVANNYN